MPGIPSKDASFVRETPRNYALTIRAMACLAVVGLHSFAKDEDISSWFYYLCGFAVPFFFMASGFFC